MPYAASSSASKAIRWPLSLPGGRLGSNGGLSQAVSVLGQIPLHRPEHPKHDQRAGEKRDDLQRLAVHDSKGGGGQ